MSETAAICRAGQEHLNFPPHISEMMTRRAPYSSSITHLSFPPQEYSMKKPTQKSNPPLTSPKVTNLNFPPKDLTGSQTTSSRAAAKIKAHKKRTNTQIHKKRINKINLVAFVQPTKKELFKCLFPALTDVRERQGLDHTIYPIGDWSVQALREWRSTASGCSPGLRLGLGSAVTLRVYSA